MHGPLHGWKHRWPLRSSPSAQRTKSVTYKSHMRTNGYYMTVRAHSGQVSCSISFRAKRRRKRIWLVHGKGPTTFPLKMVYTKTALLRAVHLYDSSRLASQLHTWTGNSDLLNSCVPNSASHVINYGRNMADWNEFSREGTAPTRLRSMTDTPPEEL